MRFRPLLTGAFLGVWLSVPASVNGFSNNNVRMDRFKWLKIQTEHFDLYYHDDDKKLIPRVAYYLEGAHKNVGLAFDYQVPNRTPFFFYSNHNHFEQTNIVPIGEGTGGVTEAFKNRFLVFNDGSETWLRHVIYHEFTHVLQFNILYGGFWKSIRLLKSPFYPLWLMEGMAEYGAGDIDEPMGDMVVRDAVANKQVPSLAELQGFGHLKPNQITLGYKTGEAAIQFLRDEYGEEKVQNFLVRIRDHFDVSTALEEELGTDLTRFDFRFQEWLTDKYAGHIAAARGPREYGEVLTRGDGIPQFNEAPVLSPDGLKIYFFSDRGGPVQLYAYDTLTKKTEQLLGLKWSRFENIHTRGRALSVSPDGRWLAFAGEKRQRDFLYLFDLDKRRLKKVKIPFDEIRSPVFSPAGDTLVCVGMEKGYNDLYLIDRDGRMIKRLTDNPQDERDPVFSNNGTSVIYSGEVLKQDQSGPDGADIFSVTLDQPLVSRLLSLKGTETEPEVLPDGSIVFVRDRDDNNVPGFDLTRYDSRSGKLTRLTQMMGGAFSPRRSPTGPLYFVAFHAGERHLVRGSWMFPDPAPVTQVDSETDFELESPGDKHTSLSLLNWPSDITSSLYMGAAKPYKFQASTDLFLPFFLYSTLDGLVLVDIWQFSEMLGNHRFQQQMQYASGSDFLDLSLFYTYAKYRPNFTVGFRTQRFYRDIDEQDQRREASGVALMTYPLDRINSVLTGIGTTDRKDTFFDDFEPDGNFDDRFLLAGFQHDTVTGRYLIPTKGRRLELFYQQGVRTLGGNQVYKSGGFEGVQYAPLPGESTIASRLFYGRSVGENAQVFRLGGSDRIRALSSRSEENKKSNVVVTSAEARLKLKYLNARTKFLFPDFFFKAAYLIAFNDLGYGWDSAQEREGVALSDATNTAGLGISWPTFILQTFKLDFTVLWAHQTTNGSEIWYITLGPSF